VSLYSAIQPYLYYIVCRLSSRLGASNVYLSDHDTKSLAHMRHDCASNNITAQVVLIDWFKPDLHMFTGSVNLRVIAGDVLYKADLIAPFMATARALLKHPGACMLLCHVPRAGVLQETVVSAAVHEGMAVRRIDRSEWMSDSFLGHCSQEEVTSAELYEMTYTV
jgi:predicted nicotinamide N-methyase